MNLTYLSLKLRHQYRTHCMLYIPLHYMQYPPSLSGQASAPDQPSPVRLATCKEGRERHMKESLVFDGPLWEPVLRNRAILPRFRFRFPIFVPTVPAPVPVQVQVQVPVPTFKCKLSL